VRPVRLRIFAHEPTLPPWPEQRADRCGPIAPRVQSADPIRCIESPGGVYAMVEYTGRTDTVIDAFRAVADEIRRSSRFDFGAGPPLELVHDVDVGGGNGVHRIDACFPVRRIRKPAGSKNRQAGAAS